MKNFDSYYDPPDDESPCQICHMMDCNYQDCKTPAKWEDKKRRYWCDDHGRAGTGRSRTILFPIIIPHEDVVEVSKKMEYVFYRYDSDAGEEVETDRKFFDLESSAFSHADNLSEKYSCPVSIRVVVEEE